MTHQIQIEQQVTVDGNMLILDPGDELEVEAVETIKLNLASGEVDVEVLLQPGPANLIQFLALSSDTAVSSLVYKPNTITHPGVYLEGTHIYRGPSMIGLIDQNPTKLYLTNSSGFDLEVTIIVGRDATP